MSTSEEDPSPPEEKEINDLPSDTQILSVYASDRGAGSTSALHDRTLEYRLRLSISNLSYKLVGLMQTIHRAAGLLRDEQVKSSEAQGKAQKAANVLSFVIAIATLAYVMVTIVSVRAQYEANDIQRQLLELQKRSMAPSASRPPAPTSPKRP